MNNEIGNRLFFIYNKHFTNEKNKKVKPRMVYYMYSSNAIEIMQF